MQVAGRDPRDHGRDAEHDREPRRGRQVAVSGRFEQRAAVVGVRDAHGVAERVASDESGGAEAEDRQRAQQRVRSHPEQS